MAILESLPGISVSIHIDDAPVAEHRDESLEDDENETTRYIEAQTGKRFVVHARTGKGTNYGGVAGGFISLIHRRR